MSKFLVTIELEVTKEITINEVNNWIDNISKPFQNTEDKLKIIKIKKLKDNDK